MKAGTEQKPGDDAARRRRRLGGMGVQTQSIVVTLLGGLLISITVSGRFTSYVRPDFRWLLLISGAILVLVGIVSLVLTVRADMKDGQHEAGHDHGPHEHGGDPDGGDPDGGDPDGADAHGHDHSSSKAPWLILVPVLVLLLVAPPALGADAVARNAGSQAIAGYGAAAVAAAAAPVTTAPTGDTGGKDATSGMGGGYKFNDGSGSARDSTGSARTMSFPALEGTDPDVPLKDFILRSLYDKDNSLDGTPVTVLGFIAPAGAGFDSGYTIARMSISCCAADASPLQLHVDGDPPFPSDTWVQAVVTNVPDSGGAANYYVPTVTVNSIQAVDQPDDPYET